MKVPRPDIKNNVGILFAIGLAFLFVIATAIIATTAAIGYFYTDEYVKLGPWGDFFGGTLNPILTFFSFIGVLFTLTLQKNRNELNPRGIEPLSGRVRKPNINHAAANVRFNILSDADPA